jgi:spermidine synthase
VTTPAAARAFPGARPLAYVCFFLSGASGLIYEVVWTRQFLLTFGTTTAAVSTVLSAFMAGLALGARAFGGAADRSRAPLRLYAYLEAGIGLYALLLPALIAWTRPAYVAAARAAAEQPVLLALLRSTLAFALLLCPTVLMGGTLPVLVRLVGQSEARFGWDLGTLYGVNVAGAVAGSLSTGFVLIRFLGVQGATMVGVVANLAISVAALLANAAAGRAAGPVGLPGREGAGPAVAREGGLPRGARPVLWAVVFLSGFVTLGYEVLWTRILIFSFVSTVYSFTVILATFLAGLALGSWLFAVFVEGKRDRLRSLAASQILAALSALALVPLTPKLHDLILALSARWGYTGTVQLLGTAASAALVMLAPATLMGLAFPLGSRLLVGDFRRAGRGVGAAYMVNTFGAVLGALVTGFALIPLFTLKGSLLLLAGVQVAVGWALLRWAGWAPARRGPLVGAAGAALALGFAGVGLLMRGPNPFEPASRFVQGSPEAIEAHHDGVTASVSVVRYANGARAIRIDGFEAAADEVGRYAYMGMLTHIPMLLHPDPRRVLVISFGTGTTAGAGLLYPDVRIDAVDINRTIFDVAPHFRMANRDVARDPRARLIVDDGRNYVLVSRERYDIITSEPMPPTYAGSVNLYSREYYALARERLNPGGFLVQWLPFHLLKLGETWAILRTVQEVFPETTAWIQGVTGIIVARRDQAIGLDLPLVRRRLAVEPVARDLRRLGVPGVADLASLFVLGAPGVAHLAGQAGVVTDDHPTLEFHPHRHGQEPLVGSYRRDQAIALEILYRMKRREPLPLRRAAPDEAAALEEFRRLTSYVQLGHLYLDLGFLPQARSEFEQGLRRAGAPGEKTGFLLGLAHLARREARAAEARRLVEESLRLVPGHPEALALRTLLEAR